MLDNLYRFDIADSANRPNFTRFIASNAGASTNVTASIVNDQGLPFFPSSVAVRALGGAAQFPVRWTLRMQSPELATFAHIAGGEFTSTTAALANFVGVFPRNLVVPQRFRLAFFVDFNAGAAANTVDIHALGWLIPRGTLALP